MSLKAGIGKIVTDGLVLCLDAADKRSGSDGTSGVWYDRNMYQHNASINGATFTDQQAKGAFYFDGVNDYISIPFGNGRDISANNVSYDIWVKPADVDTDSIFLINSSKTNSSHKFYIGQKSTNFDMGVQTSDWGDTVLDGILHHGQLIGGNSINWFNICITVTDSGTRMYRDGKNIVSREVDEDGDPYYINFVKSSSGVVFTQDLEIGGWGANGSDFFNGWISSVKVYNKTLSADEVMQNYRVMQHRHKQY
ncbi:LamG domain-containing protein [archaeon]|nr:LamG domain-containing protein [archaeon]NDB56138.1 LamG domain-containing protein [archaeon]NDB80103.1 LamG domain-containing protein [archaeon]